MLLSAYGKILQALAAHFIATCLPTCVVIKEWVTPFSSKITLKCNEIKADFFRNNVKLHRLVAP